MDAVWSLDKTAFQYCTAWRRKLIFFIIRRCSRDTTFGLDDDVDNKIVLLMVVSEVEVDASKSVYQVLFTHVVNLNFSESGFPGPE